MQGLKQAYLIEAESEDNIDMSLEEAVSILINTKRCKNSAEAVRTISDYLQYRVPPGNALKKLLELEGLQNQRIKALLRVIQQLSSSPYHFKITKPEDVYDYCQNMAYLDREVIRILCMGSKNYVVYDKIIAEGNINSCKVPYERIVLALSASNANNLIVVHNHPGGSPEPSPEDLDTTSSIRFLTKKLGFELLDHIIIAREGNCSIRELYPDYFDESSTLKSVRGISRFL